jgi:hypothetical protein
MICVYIYNIHTFSVSLPMSLSMYMYMYVYFIVRIRIYIYVYIYAHTMCFNILSAKFLEFGPGWAHTSAIILWELCRAQDVSEVLEWFCLQWTSVHLNRRTWPCWGLEHVFLSGMKVFWVFYDVDMSWGHVEPKIFLAASGNSMGPLGNPGW